MQRIFVIAAIVFLSFVNVNAETVFPGAEWETGTPESQGVDSEKLEQAVAYLKSRTGKDGVHELVIIRNGVMVWQGDDIDKVHGVWSLTKSFTSTVLGLLIEERKCTLDTKAADILPEMKAHYPGVTLRHFATMTSGYRAEGDTTTGSYKHGPSKTPFDPAPEPLFVPPGTKYAYWDSAMNQFVHVLTAIAGEKIEDYFQRKIADPIGMNRAKWDWGEFKIDGGTDINGGSGNNNNHMFISARELARFGLLFLNQGNWNGKQLIDKSWIAQACSVQVPNSIPMGNEKLSPFDGRGAYGFNWWINGMKADGHWKWEGAPLDMYSASGYNNNDLLIIPQWNMVIVRLGLDQGDRAISDSDYGTFVGKVGEAM